MCVFVATNGVRIRFKCRDAPSNYYGITPAGSSTESELRINDNGSMRRCCDDPIPRSWRQAWSEYVAAELSEYDQWAAARPYLIAEDVANSRRDLERKLDLALEAATRPA